MDIIMLTILPGVSRAADFVRQGRWDLVVFCPLTQPLLVKQS